MPPTAKSADTNPDCTSCPADHVVLIDLGACEAISNRYRLPQGEMCLPLWAAFSTAATSEMDVLTIPED
jgi:hypothetical protein